MEEIQLVKELMNLDFDDVWYSSSGTVDALRLCEGMFASCVFLCSPPREALWMLRCNCGGVAASCGADMWK